MESILIATRVVTPLFILMAIGFALRQLKIIPGETFNHVNKVCFVLFLPALVFYNVVSASTAAVNVRVMVFTGTVLIITMILTLLIIPRIIKDPPQAAACVQGAFRTNFAAMGIALVSDLLDKDGLALISLLGAVTVPIFNVCSVIILEGLRGGRVSPKALARNIVTNPLIIGSLGGAAALALNLRPTGALNKAIGDIARAATPLAIVCLGGLFDFVGVQRRLKALLVGTLGRLLILPGLCLGAAVLAGFRGNEFLSMAAVFIAPTAVASFSMAQQMGADSDTAALIILSTTFLSLVTMAFWLALTHYFHIW